MKILLLIVICVIFMVSGQLLLKRGVGKPSSRCLFLEYRKIFTTLEVWIGLICYLVSAMLWLFILQRAELSYAYPLLSLSYIFVVLASRYIFKERVSLLRWIGVGIICIGTCLVSQS